jgi:hypothetical protein
VSRARLLFLIAIYCVSDTPNPEPATERAIARRRPWSAAHPPGGAPSIGLFRRAKIKGQRPGSLRLRSNGLSTALSQAGDDEWTLLDLAPAQKDSIQASRLKSERPPGNDAQVIVLNVEGHGSDLYIRLEPAAPKR